MADSRRALAALVVVLAFTSPLQVQRAANGLAYVREGSGPAVVLVHGSNLDRRMWDEQAAWLRADHTVVRYDLRGHGASADPDEPYAAATDLIELLDELQIGTATLVGLSAGASVVIDVALVAPDRVTGLVLASPTIGGYVPQRMPEFFNELIAALQAGDLDGANEVLLQSPVMLVPAPYRGMVRAMVEGNRRLWTLDPALQQQLDPPAIGGLGLIGVPALVLVGSEDLADVRTQANLLGAQVAGAQRIEVAGGGHLLNMTSREQFDSALREFLESSR